MTATKEPPDPEQAMAGCLSLAGLIGGAIVVLIFVVFGGADPLTAVFWWVIALLLLDVLRGILLIGKPREAVSAPWVILNAGITALVIAVLVLMYGRTL